MDLESGVLAILCNLFYLLAVIGKEELKTDAKGNEDRREER